MMLPSIKDIDVQGKKVLIRVDFNVPFHRNSNDISDDTRIVKSLPTLKYLMNNQAKLVLVSHLGRPKGQREDLYSLRKVADRLKNILSMDQVHFSDKLIGTEITAEQYAKQVDSLKNGEILVLENIRFYPQETSKSVEDRNELAKIMSSCMDLYVNDAFGASHREHSSITELPKFLPAFAGFLLEKEVQTLTSLLENPKRPYIAIIGGAKINTKLNMLKNLVDKVDHLLIGGGMAYTFLKSSGSTIGNSMCEDDCLDDASEIIDKCSSSTEKLLLPVDHLTVSEYVETAPTEVTELNIPSDRMGIDIGPKTIERYTKMVQSANTIFWNGPVGAFEIKNFSIGTIELARAIANSKAKSIIGGGDTIYATRVANVEEKIDHISTGGGASLELIEGKILPGISALLK